MSSTRTVTLIGADGTRHVLACSAEPYQLRPGSTFHATAPYAFTAAPVANIPGERVERVRAQARNVVVPMQVQGLTESEIDTRLGALGGILSPRATCDIVYRRPDGTERIITGNPTGGEATTWRTSVQRHHQIPLVFRCWFPYWRAVGTIVTSGPTTFSDGRLGNSNIITITNPGDVPETWPEITVTGYAESIELLNLTSGRFLRVRRIIAEGSTLRIDTDPRTAGVWVDGVWAGDALDPLTDTWPLRPGVNTIIARANTATGTETIGTVRFRIQPLYETC